MPDVCVTVPQARWLEWLGEGDLPDDLPSDYEFHWMFGGPMPDIRPDERVYGTLATRYDGVVKLQVRPGSVGSTARADTTRLLGSPAMQRQYTPEFRARFQCRVEVSETSGCWMWTGRVSNGYGRVYFAPQDSPGAHVAAWEMASGEAVPGDLEIGHTCDIALCVRNDDEGTYEVGGVVYRRIGHLWLAPHAANILDRDLKGRTASGDRSPSRLHPESRPRGDNHPLRQRPDLAARGERVGGVRLTEQSVREIRARAATGESMRRLAAAFGVDPRTITFVVRRRTWAWLT
jgi:hypothetical protein